MEIAKKVRKAVFKKFFLAQANAKYIATAAQKMNLQPMKTNFLLVTLAFNDFELIKLQQASLKKMTDKCDRIIADNSFDNDQAQAIEAFCAEQGMGYVHLPQPNPGSKFDRSLSHGFSLNWIFYNIVKKINPEKFGFLESDVLVAEPGSFLAPWQGKDFWGMRAPSQSFQLSEMQKQAMWRLWPGFCFFSREFYQDKPLNFLPIKYVDTGGGNLEFLKDLTTEYLIPMSAMREKEIPGGEKVQCFANVVHLVGMSIKGDGQEERNKKREFANAVAFGNEKIIVQ